MSKYKVQFSKSAVKDIKKLPKVFVKRVLSKIYSLSDNPRPAGCKKIVGTENLWRIRVGDYRILYTVEDDILLIEIVSIGHRKDIYD